MRIRRRIVHWPPPLSTNVSDLPGIPMRRVLLAGMRARVPVLIWGKPGVGKTAVIEQMAAQLGMHCETINASTREAADFLGLPVEVNGQVHYAAPAWAHRLNDAPKAVAFIDELTTCTKQTFAGLLRVFQERWVGELKLGDDVVLLSAANPPEIAVNGNELDPPNAGRFLHLDWILDREGWFEHVGSDFANVPAPEVNRMLSLGGPEERARAAGWVNAYLRNNDRMLEPDIPESFGTPSKPGSFGPCYAYPSPRSWHNLQRVLTHLRADDEASILLAARGLVGESAASTFTAWLRGASLYNPADVLAGRVIVDWTSSPDRIYALNDSLTSIAKADGRTSVYQKVVDLFEECVQIRPDVAIVPMRSLLSTLPREVHLSETLRDRVGRLAVPGSR